MTDTPDANPQPAQPWYLKRSVLVFAILSVGPLALPLLWINPRVSTANKILWSALVLAVTIVFVTFSVTTVQKLIQQYRDLGLIS